jgi:MinD superfamily P-loop ATPase
MSGKGGTGKTTVAVALARSIPGAQLLDCDVEEPNAHLFLRPEIEAVEDVRTMIPRIDPARCDGCADRPRAVCPSVCAFGALSVVSGKVLVFEEMCHGCGACLEFCPRDAITEGTSKVGEVAVGRSGDTEFVMGTLAVGQPRSIPVIRAVKQHTRPNGTAIYDAPPGVSCSAVETLRGADAALLVTEPTPFGLHDLELALSLCREMNVPAAIVLNRADLGDPGVTDFARRESVEILLRIPWDRTIAEAGARGEILTTTRPEYRRLLFGVVERLREIARGSSEAA